MEACFKNDGRTAQLKKPLLVSAALSVEPEKKREEQVSSCLKKGDEFGSINLHNSPLNYCGSQNKRAPREV